MRLPIYGGTLGVQNSSKTREVPTRFRQALAEQRGMRPLVGHCRLSLGNLYRRAGKQEAQKHLTTAATACREVHS